MLNHNGETDHVTQTGPSPNCVACGAEYAITSAEQAFRSEHRLGAPTLCPECRSRQRAGRNAEIIAIYEKSTNADFSASAPPATRNTGKSNVRGQLFSTVCDACGSETRVPFVPRGDRPVYCKDCFNARRGR